MDNKAPLTEESTTRLKNIVEQSIAVLCDSDDSARADARREPISRRSLPLHIDAANLQKRALSDAAKALSVLWKITKAAPDKLHTRSMQPSRQTS